MSLEILNRTSDIKTTKINSKSIRMSPSKVNIDVLKNRVINEKKKKAFQSKIILFSVFLSIGILGYLAD